MRKICYLMPLLVALFLSGCRTEKDVILAYLTDLAVSQSAVQDIAMHFGGALEQLSQSRTAVQIDAPVWNEKWDRWTARLLLEKDKIATLPPPPGAEPLQQSVLDQYEILRDTIETTRPLIEIADKLAEANRRVEEDPASAPEIIKEMAPVEAKREQVAEQLEALLERSRQAENKVRDEQKKIEKKYGIALQMEKG